MLSVRKYKPLSGTATIIQDIFAYCINKFTLLPLYPRIHFKRLGAAQAFDVQLKLAPAHKAVYVGRIRNVAPVHIEYIPEFAAGIEVYRIDILLVPCNVAAQMLALAAHSFKIGEPYAFGKYYRLRIARAKRFKEAQLLGKRLCYAAKLHIKIILCRRYEYLLRLVLPKVAIERLPELINIRGVHGKPCRISMAAES